MEPSFIFKKPKWEARRDKKEAALPDDAARHIEEAALLLINQARGAKDFASTYSGGFGASHEAGEAAYDNADSYMRTAETLFRMIGKPVGYAYELRDQLVREATMAAQPAPAAS